ncbi:MAG: hypothetical protein ACOC2N_03340 [Spirochaetota bacterium]
MYFLVFGPGIGIQTGASALISNALGAGGLRYTRVIATGG